MENLPVFDQQDRRSFLATACQLCGMVATAGIATSLATLTTSCAAAKTSVRREGNQLVIALKEWPKDKDGKTLPLFTTKVEGLPFDLAIVKTGEDAYKALYLQCTHKVNPVNWTGDAFVCPDHGSRFDLQGDLKKGPAKTGLKTYPVTKRGDEFVVSLVSDRD